MLTRLEVQTASGLLLNLPLDDFSDGFPVQDITGLDPVKAVIVSTSFAQQDGEQYQAARRDKRNIVIKLGLEPDYSTSSVRSLRNTLYGFFMPKSEVLLRFISEDEPTVEILGRVESFESPQFVKDPTATISVLCFDPDFIDPTPRLLTGSSVSTLTETLVNYSGTVETGFVFNLKPDRAITQFSLLNRSVEGQQRQLDFAGALQVDDDLEISTVSGNKYAILTRAGFQYSFLYGVSAYSDWLNLFPGENHMRLSIPGAPVPYTIRYTDKYGGL